MKMTYPYVEGFLLYKLRALFIIFWETFYCISLCIKDSENYHMILIHKKGDIKD